MANWYVSSVGWAAVTQWAATTAYSVGNIRRQLASAELSERVFRCTTAGTSGGGEPVWILTEGSTTVDNTVVWTEITGNETYQSPGAWAAPFRHIEEVLQRVSAGETGDNIYVASNHSINYASNYATYSSLGTFANPVKVICVDETGSGHVPPSVAADLKTTARETCQIPGAYSNMQFSLGCTYYYGISFTCGTGGFTAELFLGGYNGNYQIFDSCAIGLTSTISSTNPLRIGSVNADGTDQVTFINTTLGFALSTNTLYMAKGRFVWRNTANAVTGNPTTMFSGDNSNSQAGEVFIEGVDLSNLTGTLVPSIYGSKKFFFKDCKLNSAVTIAATPLGAGFAETYVVRSDSSGTNYRNEKYTYQATQKTEAIIIRTNGASDGTTGFSYKITTTTLDSWANPFEATPIVIWNRTIAGNVICTLEGLWNSASLPKNDEVWFDMEYLGSSATPKGSFVTGTKAASFLTGTNLTASTKAWDGQVTARANTHAYSSGDVIKVASNPGRIFFCTTGGTSAGSEPGGYASAVDGGSVTDNTAVFRAAVRFSQSVTLTGPTPNMQGYLYAYIKVAKISSTFYIDPLLALS